jgi:hypothetical protein
MLEQPLSPEHIPMGPGVDTAKGRAAPLPDGPAAHGLPPELIANSLLLTEEEERPAEPPALAQEQPPVPPEQTVAPESGLPIDQPVVKTYHQMVKQELSDYLAGRAGKTDRARAAATVRYTPIKPATPKRPAAAAMPLQKKNTGNRVGANRLPAPQSAGHAPQTRRLPIEKPENSRFTFDKPVQPMTVRKKSGTPVAFVPQAAITPKRLPVAAPVSRVAVRAAQKQEADFLRPPQKALPRREIGPVAPMARGFSAAEKKPTPRSSAPSSFEKKFAFTAAAPLRRRATRSRFDMPMPMETRSSHPITDFRLCQTLQPLRLT